jgi:hypothetical protein
MTQQLLELNAKVDEMLKSQRGLQETVDGLSQTIRKLEDGNKHLLKLNQEVQAKNVALSKELKNADTTISTLNDELESHKQRFLSNTVEILGVTITEADEPLNVVQKLGQAVQCQVEESDVSNIYVRAVPQRKGPPRQKIIVVFSRQNKRMDFYYKCRRFRLSPPPGSAAELRKINVVDALTQFKKVIYFEIIEGRKKQPDIVKNVWVNDGEIWIRRFGSSAPEPVKNMAFVAVIFDKAQPPPIDTDADDDDAEHHA